MSQRFSMRRLSSHLLNGLFCSAAPQRTGMLVAQLEVNTNRRLVKL